MKDLSLYIHIPFCVKKCNYCDFLSAACTEETRQEYVEALCIEITQRAPKFRDKKVDTIFFGGGTPSILSVKQFEKIMTTIRKEFHVLKEAEISLELNPGTANWDKLQAYYKHGVNRLSIGLQSADNEELKVLGRIHNWETFLQTWKLVRKTGFSNVNIDLMSALPGQTLESYENTLRKVLELKPEHISAYSLIIEEGTKFYQWYEQEEGLQTDGDNDAKSITEEMSEVNLESQYAEFRKKKLPDEITDRRMYELTKKMLEEQGYYRYEISNYALKGYECRHNIGYWKRKEYLGLGLGASSLIANIRSNNISDLEQYRMISQKANKIRTERGTEEQFYELKDEKVIQQCDMDWVENQEILSVKEQMEEFMFLGLRMMEGVCDSDFEAQFVKSLQEVYGKQITKMINQGLLKFYEKENRYALTLKGIDVSNQVFVEFILPTIL